MAVQQGSSKLPHMKRGQERSVKLRTPCLRHCWWASESGARSSVTWWCVSVCSQGNLRTLLELAETLLPPPHCLNPLISFFFFLLFKNLTCAYPYSQNALGKMLCWNEETQLWWLYTIQCTHLKWALLQVWT